MYRLSLIIFVVSGKKAFEHFPKGSNVNLCHATKGDKFLSDLRQIGSLLRFLPPIKLTCMTYILGHKLGTTSFSLQLKYFSPNV
jgi:hypothetical protein